MRRGLVAAWLLALAVVLARPWRWMPKRYFINEVPRGAGDVARGSAAPEPGGLGAPEPVLTRSARARFSRPGAAAGGLPGELPPSTGLEPDEPRPGAPRARLGAMGGTDAAGAAGGAAVYGPGAGRGPDVGREGAAGGGATADGSRSGETAGGGARRAGPGDGRTAFDGVPAAAGSSSAPGAGAASGGPGGRAGGAGGSAGAGSGAAGGGLLGALTRFGGGADSAANRAPGDVEGRPVGGEALSAAAASAGGGAAPGPVEGRPVDPPPGEGDAPTRPLQGAAYAAPVPGAPQPPQPPAPSGAAFRTDARTAPTVGTAQVRREDAKGAVVFEADMDIDADGEGGWHRADRTGQSQTALTYPNGKSLNPGTLPFMVVPVDFHRTHPGVKLGDYGAISYRGRSVYAIVGDKGPAGVIGEASISAALSLGINADPNRGGVDSGVRYYILPGTADRVPPADAGAVQQRGAQLFREQNIPLR